MQKSNITFGFTLLEMLVVLIVIAVSFGLFWNINFSQKDKLRSQGLVRELSQFVRTAKSFAIIDGLNNQLIYDPENNQLREILRDKSIALPEHAFLGESRENNFEDRQVLIEFFADGSLAADPFVLCLGPYTYNLDLEPLFGNLEVSMEKL